MVVETPESLRRDGYELHEQLGEFVILLKPSNQTISMFHTSFSLFSGEGAYSTVFRATNEKTSGVNYACKRYKINEKTIKWVERCLHREMSLVMKVRHRSIVEAFTAIRAGNEAFLILQYAPGGSIRAYLRKKLAPEEYLTEHKIRSWMSDLFAAVGKRCIMCLEQK